MTRHPILRRLPVRRPRVPVRLVTWQLLLTLVLTLVVGTAVVTNDQRVRGAAEGQMRDTAALTEVFLRQEVDRTGQVMAQVALQPRVAAALAHPDRPASSAALQAAMQAMSLADPGLYTALGTDARGVVVAENPYRVPIGYHAADRQWFQRAVSVAAGHDLSPVFESSFVPGLFLTTVSVPVWQDGRLVGVLAVAQRLDWYQAFVSSYAASRGVRLSIVDQDGLVVADGAGRLPDSATRDQRAALGRQLLRPARDAVRVTAGSRAGTGPGPGAGAEAGAGQWRVIAEIPDSVAMRPSRFFTAVAIVVGAVLAVLLNLILWLRVTAATSRRRGAVRVAESRRQLREIADSSPDLLYRMDLDGTVQFASRASWAILGIPDTALVGSNLPALLEVEGGPDAPDLELLIRDAAERGETLSVAARTGTPGRRRIVELDVRPGDTGELLGSIRDVTERRSSQDQVEQLFQLTGEFMAVLDFDGRLVQVNPVWERSLDRARGQLVGRSYFQFFRFDDLPRARADFDRMTAGGQVLALEGRYTRAGAEHGRSRSLLWAMAADRDRRLVYAVGHDITRHRELETALASARDEALAASRTKSEFVATMSHEIRTPMNGVIGLTDLLAGTPLEGPQRRYVDGIRAAGEALLSVINDILDFSKIEAGRMVLEQVDFRPADVVADVLTLVRQSAAAKGLGLDLELDQGVAEVVNGDPGRLRQLLLNLMHNAVKFTAHGVVTMRVLPRPGFGIAFEVVDTGIGIAPEKLEELFEPFQQADAGVNRAYGGTGLGLSICRRLAELMAGTLNATSAPGRGTTFTAGLEFGEPRGDVLARRGEGRTGDARSLTVLIVDTDEDSRVAMANQLSDWGMRPIAVGSPDEAVMALAWTGATSGHVDLAIVDVCSVPESEADPEAGLDLIRQLRQIDGLAAVPIIAIGDEEPLAAHRTELGISAVLVRPVQPSAVFDALSRVSLAGGGQSYLHEPEPEFDLPDGGRYLLLVEDNEINQMVASGMLSRLGHRVDVAGDGHEALLKSGRHEYDAILMDCQMPRLDGYAATRELRRRERTRSTPIIAMTAATMDSDRQRCFDAGMDDFISKPVRFAMLKDVLARWLDHDARPGTSGDPALARLGEQLPQPRVSQEASTRTEMDERLAELLGDGADDERDLVGEIVASFQERAPLLAASVAEALAAGDLQGSEQRAHALAGAALNLGAEAIAGVCRRIEAAARAGQLPDAAQFGPDLEIALGRDLDALADAASTLLG